MESLPRTRAEAVKVGSKHYFTGKPCKRGHFAPRYVCNRHCSECRLEDDRNWRTANPEKVRERVKKFRLAHLEEERARDRNRYWSDPEKERARGRAYQKANPHVFAAHTAKRRSAKLQATPPWLTEEHLASIRHIYETCPEGYQVDHIVPLQGETVCGLHVPWNLQHLSASENATKRNKLIEEMIYDNSQANQR